MALETAARQPRSPVPWSARDWLASYLGLEPWQLEVVDVSSEEDAATYRTPDGRVMVVLTAIDRFQRRVWCRLGSSTAEAFIARDARISWEG